MPRARHSHQLIHALRETLRELQKSGDTPAIRELKATILRTLAECDLKAEAATSAKG